ncbi:MAG: class I SAM-dependent DNA methyltransferase [Desulfomonilaceae bacterium]
MSVFDAYSRYYDLLYQDKDYLAESDYIGQLILKNVRHVKRILELGCGTGAHAISLAKLGFSIHGIDLSSSMLERAELKREGQSPEIRRRSQFSPGDIRKFRAGKVFDTVISLFHVLSYQTGNHDVMAMFETAASHLAQGGLFIFYFWYDPAVLTQKPEVRIKRFSDENTSVIELCEPELKVNQNIVDVNFEVIVEDLLSGKREVIKEEHPMRYFFLPEIDLVCESTGFENVNFEAWMGGPVSDQSWGVTGYGFRS